MATTPGSDKAAGIVLIAAAALAMVFANSPLAGLYEDLIRVQFEVRLGTASLEKPMLLWVNDGLMAVFFLLVGLELKRELLEGELSSWQSVLMPLAGAFGGIVTPALVYALCNLGDARALGGWAIPAATDIAFALGVLAMVGDRVPASLKTFLLSLAVFDDIGAIVIIAAFYTDNISWGAKIVALGALAVLVLFNRLRITRLGPYMLVGAVMWLGLLKSGVHATLAGAALGFTIPLRTRNALGHSPLRQLEHVLHPWVSFLIVPLFAFANAGVALGGEDMDPLSGVTVGIAAGLLLGKALGVYGACALTRRFAGAPWPAGATPRAFFAVCVLSGIGFTMSLFVGTLAFEAYWAEMGGQVKLGVLGGSLISAILGFVLLRRALRQ